MAAITASMVAELRAKTDAPMMECKKALTEAEGDLVKAEELLRVKLGTKAGKAASRVTAEGVIRSEEHTSELQSPCNLVCRLLLEKKKNTKICSSNIVATIVICTKLLRHAAMSHFTVSTYVIKRICPAVKKRILQHVIYFYKVLLS